MNYAVEADLVLRRPTRSEKVVRLQPHRSNFEAGR